MYAHHYINVIRTVCLCDAILYRENWRGICTKSHDGVITGYITPDQSAAQEKCVAAWEGRGRGGAPRPIDWEPVIASPVIQQTKVERATDSCFTSIGARASGWHAHGLIV